MNNFDYATLIFCTINPACNPDNIGHILEVKK